MAGKNGAKKVYAYRTGTRIWIAVIDALLIAIMAMAYSDQSAWIGGLPLISLILVPIVIYFAWVVWRDGGQRVTVSKDGIVWERGSERSYKKVSLLWGEIDRMRDDTRIFTLGRRFRLISSSRPGEEIMIDSALDRYKELLRDVIGSIPKGVIDKRAQRSLRHIRLLK